MKVKQRMELDRSLELYRFHWEENNSPTREYYLHKFSKLMDKAVKKMRLILFIK
ncbi:hypothetical protein MKX01_037353, partial [Papaver californicum]